MNTFTAKTMADANKPTNIVDAIIGLKVRQVAAPTVTNADISKTNIVLADSLDATFFI